MELDMLGLCYYIHILSTVGHFFNSTVIYWMLMCGDTVPHTVDTVINKTEAPVLKELIF